MQTVTHGFYKGFEDLTLVLMLDWKHFTKLVSLAPKCSFLGDILSVYLTQVQPDVCFKAKIAFPTVFPQNRCLSFHFHTEHVGIGLLHSRTMPVCIRWNLRAYFPKQ